MSATPPTNPNDPELRVRESQLAVPGALLQLVEVAAEAATDVAARPLVLLHGGPGASHDYLRPQLDRLASPRGADRRLIYYDQRGSGRSPLVAGLDAGTAPGTAADHVADLERVRLHLEPTLTDGRIDLLGYSWGGLLAMLYALERPERIGRLVLLSSAPSHADARGEFQRNLRLAERRPEVAALRESLRLDELQARDPAAARRARFALAVTGYFVEPRNALSLTPFRVIQKAEQAVWASLEGFDLRPRLPSLRGTPMLVVHGREDPLPVATAVETAEAAGARLVLLDRCGHVPYVEAPEALFAVLEPFLGHR